LKRGDLYRVYKGNKLDPREFRIFVIVSRQVVIDSNFSTVICAPVYSRWDELSSQVLIGQESGLKHDSAIHCDELVSLPKLILTNYIGTLTNQTINELNNALKVAIDIDF